MWPGIRRLFSSQRQLLGATCLALACMFMLFGCGLELPKAPEFETTLNIPLGVETYTGLDVANGLESVEGDSTSAGPLAIEFSAELDSITLEDGLSCDVPARSVAALFEQIAFRPPSIAPCSYTLGEMMPGIPPGGIDAIVESFAFGPLLVDLGTFDEYREMLVTSAELRLTMVNRLPMAIGGPIEQGQAVTIAITDESVEPPRAIARFVIATPLLPADSCAALCNLRDVTIGNHLVVTLSGWCAGSGGEIIHLAPDDGVDLRLAFGECEIGSLTGLIPPFRLAGEESIPLSEGLSLREATVASGQLMWRVTSELPVAAAISVRLEEALRGDMPLVIEGSVPPFGEALLGTDLAGVTIRGDDLRSLTCHADVVTERAQSDCTVELGKGVRADLSATEIAFASVRGVLDQREITVDAAPVEVDFPSEAEGIIFTAAEAVIDIRNGAGAALNALLVLHGVSGGDTVSVPITADVPAGSADAPSETRLTLNEADSRILELANLQPEEIWIDGMVLVGDGVSEASVRASDLIAGDCTVQVPMRMIVESAEYTGDPFDVDIDKSTREKIAENLEQGDVIATVENHFPAGVRVAFHFSRSEEALFVDDDLIIDAGEIPPARIDPGRGRVTASEYCDLNVQVSGESLALFAEPHVFGGVTLTLRGNGDDPCEVWTTDYVTIRGIVSFRCRVR